MKENYAASLHFVLQAEGGYSDDPGDTGGATMRGITHLEYDAYRKAHGLPRRPVREISDAEVLDIYRRQYWDRVAGDALPFPLDLIAMDTAVNMGVGTAVKFLWQADGHAASYRLAPSLLHVLAAKSREAVHAIAGEFLLLREERYHRIAEIPHDRKFLRGWLNRLNALRHLAGC